MPRERHKFLIFLLLTTANFQHGSTDDAEVMAKLARSLTPFPSGWTGTNFCKWQGVSCDSSNKVSSINLSSRSLSGTLPSELNQLLSLKSLSFQRNHLSGPLPALSNLGNLEEVNLDENSFNSIPPDFLSGLTSLQSFSINNNSNLPPWTIPQSLKDSISLTSFLASKANIVGEIPDIFGSLPNFQTLRLSYNNLTGSLPSSFAKSGIQNLWLNNQAMGFSGTVDVIGAMTQVQVVWLHSNKFSGPIPDLSACTELSDLQLRDNLLTGVIPDSLTKLPKLQNVALQNNKFQGPMPSFPRGVQVNLGNENNFCLPAPGPCDPQVTSLLEAAGAMNYPMTLAESWAGNNPCQQWKFITCDKGSVTVINFAKQNWTGTISPAYANVTNLKSLLLNDNDLEGTIPQSLTSLMQLQILDLSNNNISGKIPDFPSSVTVRVSGNPWIGKDLPTKSSGGSFFSDPFGTNGGGSSVAAWVIVVPVVALLIIAAVLGFLFYKRKQKNKNYKWVRKESEIIMTSLDQPKDNVKSPTSGSSNVPETPIRSSGEKSDYNIYDGGNITIPIEILREATDNFSESNILGRGGFGIVYKGQLHDGTRIAVKRMESSMITDKGLHEFKSEIEVLTKVRHRHLVSLHGFCDNGSERLLVYEYMPKGCLGQHLFQWKEMEIPPLSWNQRVIIALDVARGVEYLHSLAQQSFIHRDLKTSNILLGDDVRAKVSDFGLVKPAPDGNYSVETRLAGTFGYLAPEYAGMHTGFCMDFIHYDQYQIYIYIHI
ncbi:Fibroblast/platelet-derived growth factor receptor [Handroanthus impetiginosus]|uniref:Fibroblast/platelet-derived growth factor receptor n=1 Tax=Handroanthus impetiginosus TaxID=429701 RepID=A0A2G9H906_9LAMI|nr:Fibroblast/platelet-derived growth factor receptor [Handroanthus impetiginosus]